MILPICDNCGADIAPKPKATRQYFCSRACWVQAHGKTEHQTFCSACFVPISGRKDKKYCGLTCKNLAYQRKHTLTPQQKHAALLYWLALQTANIE